MKLNIKMNRKIFFIICLFICCTIDSRIYNEINSGIYNDINSGIYNEINSGIYNDINSQIYNNIIYVDKFNDEIYSEQIKSLVTIEVDEDGEGYITIEKKGHDLECYEVYMTIKYGEKNKPINLIENEYGYQCDYYCRKIIEQKDTTYESKKEFILEKYINNYILTDRVISNQHTNEYIDRIFWIKKLSNNTEVDRIIYIKSNN